MKTKIVERQGRARREPSASTYETTMRIRHSTTVAFLFLLLLLLLLVPLVLLVLLVLLLLLLLLKNLLAVSDPVMDIHLNAETTRKRCQWTCEENAN
jgi:hypothetical protein